MYMVNKTDIIFGISKKICRTFIEKYNVDRNKIVYKETPVNHVAEQHIYEMDRRNPIKIGFAARITKALKRADLLVQLVNKMNKKNINFSIKIAGDGSYFERMKSDIDISKGNVVISGKIPREEMQDFWEDRDIFLSTSDLEGSSVSMLEAMSAGAVPVVTLVSGVEEFIANGVNGYVSEPGNIDGLINGIVELERNREKLKEMGNYNLKIINERCNHDDYLDVFEQII